MDQAFRMLGLSVTDLNINGDCKIKSSVLTVFRSNFSKTASPKRSYSCD